MRDIKLNITCPRCGSAHSVEVTEHSYNSWMDGELSQEAFPYLSATEREQILSLLCPACQKVIFGE